MKYYIKYYFKPECYGVVCFRIKDTLITWCQNHLDLNPTFVDEHTAIEIAKDYEKQTGNKVNFTYDEQFTVNPVLHTIFEKGGLRATISVDENFKYYVKYYDIEAGEQLPRVLQTKDFTLAEKHAKLFCEME